MKLNCAKLLAASKASHLVVADGDRRVQEVSDLPKMLEALRLQPQPLPVSLPDGFVHQQPDLLDLGHRQALLHKHQQGNLKQEPTEEESQCWPEQPLVPLASQLLALPGPELLQAGTRPLQPLPFSAWRNKH